MLRLKSLGQTLIEAGDARLTPAAETVFATALYLILEAGRRVEREELTRMLWPGVSEAQAQHGLRQALYRLKALGATIKADRSGLILAPRFCTTDFAPLFEAQTPASLESLADTIGGSFLPGYRPDLSADFATWVDQQRDIVHSAVARTLVAGMQAKKRVSDWSGAEHLASKCLTIDPLNEEATLTVAEAAALGGSKTRALSILNTYLEDIGGNAGDIKLPAMLLRRRISEAYQDNIFPVRDAPFVGREDEMAELTRALARAQSGQGSAYVIWGEPGIGKTRLVSEFTRVASLQRVHIVRVACQSHDVRRPLSAFVDMVPKLLALPGALGCSPESMKYLRRLTAHDPEEARVRQESEETEISYDRARAAVLDVLDAVANETCCLIELEDAQWLDQLSTLVIEAIGARIGSHRVLLLLTSRLCAPTGEAFFNVLLRPLAKDASSLVAHALPKSRLHHDETFLSWCVSSSGGNPFYLIELLRHGTLEGDGYQAPKSLERLLQTRVNDLDATARSLLEVCCVLGTHSTLYRIERCIELSRMETLRGLNELDANGMIELDGSSVLSRHDLLSAAVITQMSLAARAMLHRYVAAQLELEADSSHSVSLIWESAEHWLLANDSPRAIQLLRRCGNYLMDVGMPEEAAHVLERAESLTVAPAERYQVGAELARALMRAERSEEALGVLQKLLLTRNSVHPAPSPLDEVAVMSLQARHENGHPVPQILDDCLRDLASNKAAPQERLSAARWALTAADNLCDENLARRVYDLVSGQLKSSNVTPDMRLWFEMIYHSCAGDGALARDLADELAEYSLLKRPPIIAVRHFRHASHVHRCHGTIERALSLAHLSFTTAKELDSPRLTVLCASHLGSVFMHAGDLIEAQSWLNRASESSPSEKLTVLAMNTWSYRIELAIRQSDPEVAERYLALCLPAAKGTQAARSRVREMAMKTQLAVLKNESPSAVSLDSFVQLFDRVKTTTWHDYTVESLYKGLASTGKEDQAREIVTNFVFRHRRDRGSLSAYLQAIMTQL